MKKIYFIALMCTLTIQAGKDTQLIKKAEHEHLFKNAYINAEKAIKAHDITRAKKYVCEAIYHKPDSFAAHNLLAALYTHEKNYSKAVEHYETAQIILPDSPYTLLRWADILRITGLNEGLPERFDQALDLYMRVFNLDMSCDEALINIGHIFRLQGKPEKAIRVYSSYLKRIPLDITARFRRAECYLAVGNFDTGWHEYECRVSTDLHHLTDFSYWQGINPQDKTIVIISECGLGDTFQFVRYVKELKNRGAKTIVIVREAQIPILSLCPYIDVLLPHGTQVPEHDYRVQMLSLPHGFKTKIETIPNTVPYLHARKDLVEYWQKQLADDHNIKVGICWRGEINQSPTKFMPLSYFAKLTTIPNVSVYSIQKHPHNPELDQELTRSGIRTFQDLDTDHGGFMDTAALMKNFDVVLTVDTSIAHLAGGLGVPTWIVLPFPAEWRWLTEGDDSPWYPTMRLYRQDTFGEWDNLLTRIRADLITLTDTIL